VKPHLRPHAQPLAAPENVVQGDRYRITVLDTGLLRLEYSDSGEFEDRPSQTVVDRAFAPTEFHLTEDEHELELHTERLHLIYDKRPFSAEGLSVMAKGGVSNYRSVWRPGHTLENLGGTARTLDEADGRVPLEDGVLGRNGIAVVDDSRTVLLEDDGWIAPRRPGTSDLYAFAYGRDYRAALRALYKLTGPQPLLPRYALGNWWSRYYAYSADEYLELMDRFADEGLPFSVAVLDMDWHLVDIDPSLGSGWTGYTFNRDLFPDPPAFMAELHERGLAVSLNVHPADGVRAHEDAYSRVAERMGIDPASKLPVHFDPADPHFLETYLEELHHPLEDEGVDFWWLDWQQGEVTKLPGLDPLWLLNHFHFLDSARNGRRPLTFSRYAGIGSHRYPVGFSGDTVVSWASLDFQPEFTATASNAGYGWWSHDVGGHYFGVKDDELVTRWVQLGVFSPILRLHSTADRFIAKEPWRFGEVARRLIGEWLRLRHRLVPYIATMGLRAHKEGAPLVSPMYYDHPAAAAAYEVPNQFMFGTELLVAPITSPMDLDTRLGAVNAWLPEGEWLDVFTGLRYRGGRTIALHRDLDTIPVLVRPGTVLPLAADGPGTDVPERLELHVFAGGDGAFTLAEDRDDGRWAHTTFAFRGGELVIGVLEGERATLPDERSYVVIPHGFGDDAAIDLGTLDPAEEHSIRLPEPAAGDDTVERLFARLDRAHIANPVKNAIYDAVSAAPTPADAALELIGMDLPPAVLAAVTELLLAR
jgi:alpha-glucosidase (family GH31 glycosyl hydrolase)